MNDERLRTLSYTALVKVLSDVAHVYKRSQDGRNQEVCFFWNDMFVALDRELNRRLANGFEDEEGCK